MANPKLPRATKERRGTVKPSRERTRPAEAKGSETEPLPLRDFAAVALSYVGDVLAGRIVAG